jgi:hypothetical protein
MASMYPFGGPRFLAASRKVHETLAVRQLLQWGTAPSQRTFLRRHASQARPVRWRFTLIVEFIAPDDPSSRVLDMADVSGVGWLLEKVDTE